MLEAFGLSDPGCVRPNNEDYFISDSESGIFVLADGMGGANGGEFASRLGAERLYEILLNSPAGDGNGVLEQAFLEANTTVREFARENPALDGMGTTLVAVRRIDDAVFEIGSVGDSRAYLVSGGQLTLVTQDQTWLAEVGSQLGLSDEALKKHPMRHVLTMAIGSSEELRVYSRKIEMSPGDQLLLCCDGLHGVLNDEALSDTLASCETLPEKCRHLIEAAKTAGGPDNITVVLIQLL
jgi:serine/threonine protein phosphatase PrpC